MRWRDIEEIIINQISDSSQDKKHIVSFLKPVRRRAPPWDDARHSTQPHDVPFPPRTSATMNLLPTCGSQFYWGALDVQPTSLFSSSLPSIHHSTRDQVLQHLSSHNVTKSFSCLPVSSSTPRSPSRRLPRSSVWKSIRPSSVSSTATFPFPPAASPKPLTKSNFQHYITMLTKCVLLWVFPCVYGELFVC